MRVLVTGATGHVGGAIAARLAADGHETYGVGRRISRVPGLAGAVAVDLANQAAERQLEDSVPRCDAIVHAAASLDKDWHAPAIPLVNGLGAQTTLRLADRWGVSSFVFISGVTVIGQPRRLPITETHPVAPASAYHASKLFGEHLVQAAGTSGLPGCILRVTAPVGAGMPPGRILSVFVAKALAGEPLTLLGEGGREQDYIDVRDVATAVVACLERRPTGTFNVASGRPLANVSLARRCVEVTGSESSIEFFGADPEETLRWVVSSTRARRVLGFSATTTIDESIEAVARDLERASAGPTMSERAQAGDRRDAKS